MEGNKRVTKKSVGWVQKAPQRRCGECAYVEYVDGDAWSIGKPVCRKYGFQTRANAVCDHYAKEGASE